MAYIHRQNCLRQYAYVTIEAVMTKSLRAAGGGSAPALMTRDRERTPAAALTPPAELRSGKPPSPPIAPLPHISHLANIMAITHSSLSRGHPGAEAELETHVAAHLSVGDNCPSDFVQMPLKRKHNT